MIGRQVSLGVPVAALRFDEPGNTVWAAGIDGSVVTVRLLDEHVTVRGSGYVDVAVAVPLSDGLRVAVAERSGEILLAARAAADRATAAPLATLAAPVRAADLHPDGAALLVLADADLVAVDLATGDVTTVATVPDARTFTVDALRGEAFVLAEAADGSQTVSIVDLAGGGVVVLPTALTGVTGLVTSPFEHAVLCTGGDPLGAVTVVRADGTDAVAPEVGGPVTAVTRWRSAIVYAVGSDLTVADWEIDEGPLPVAVPLGPLFVGGYARVHVDAGALGLQLSDLELTVAEGPELATVSAGLEPQAADGTWPVMLLAGVFPGEYHLQVTERSTGKLLSNRRFRVTACWPSDQVGPPVAITGPMHLLSWGGTGAFPDYTAKTPAPPVLKVAVVLVTTKEGGYGAAEAPVKAEWTDHLLSATSSARRYYDEVSYGQMDVQLLGNRVLGPVALDAGWGDVFKVRTAGNVDAGWMSTVAGKELMANSISSWLADQPDGFAIERDADAVVIVVRSASAGPVPMGTNPPLPTQFVWGHANLKTKFWRKDPATSTFSQGIIPIVLMNDRNPAYLGANIQDIEQIVCHELGHALDLDDLYDANGDYPAEINERTAKRADLMATTRDVPHLSVANRMRLGWLPKAWVRRFDFAASPTGGSVPLQAIESLSMAGPPAGRFAAVEVPIQDGWSYFFEYRREQPQPGLPAGSGEMGDQRLDALAAGGRGIIGTDVRVSPGEAARPPILLLPADADGDGPVLDAVGEDYSDSDVTNPARMFDFNARLASLGPDANLATLDIDYLQANRPELLVHPAPGRGDFKSRDISLVGPFGMGLPVVVKGATNLIEITVHNTGTLAATDVKVHVKWLPFTVAAGTWNTLPDPGTFTVPARSKHTFQIPWPVPKSTMVGTTEAEHFCVRVEIDRYTDPAHPDRDEIVVHNNWAQSNFSTSWVANGSPSARTRTAVTATNSLDRDAVYEFAALQTGELFRVYVGNAWRQLAPGETSELEFAYESLAGDPVHGDMFDRYSEALNRYPSDVALTSWLEPSSDTECPTSRPWFGAGVRLIAGRKCWVRDARWNGEVVQATFEGSVNSTPTAVWAGTAYLSAWLAERPDEQFTADAQIHNDGTAYLLLPQELIRALFDGAKVTCLVARKGDHLFAETVSEMITLR